MKKRHIIFNKSRWEKIAYLEPYKDNDNSINYQDLDVNQEEDEICVAELQPGPPYNCQMLKLDENIRAQDIKKQVKQRVCWCHHAT